MSAYAVGLAEEFRTNFTKMGGAVAITTRALPAGTRVLLVRYGGSSEVSGRAVRRTVRVG